MANATVARNRGIPSAQPLLAPNWFLALVPRQFWNVEKRFFIYSQNFVPINAGQTLVGNIQIQDDSHFLAVAGVALVTDAATDGTVINSPSNANASGKLVLVTDVATGVPLSQVPVPLESLFGTAQLPAVWPMPRLFRKGGTIATQVASASAANHNVRISYWGIRIYPNIPLGAVV